MARRRVQRVDKHPTTGDITALHGDDWGRVSKAQAIVGIDNAWHSYFVNEDGTNARVYVVREDGRVPYLRSVASPTSRNQLKNLPTSDRATSDQQGPRRVGIVGGDQAFHEAPGWVIKDAIGCRIRLWIDYGPGLRLVEPYACGFSRKHDPLLYAYQTEGASSSGGIPAWRMFRLDRMRMFAPDSETFAIREEYDPEGMNIYRVVARL